MKAEVTYSLEEDNIVTDDDNVVRITTNVSGDMSQTGLTQCVTTLRTQLYSRESVHNTSHAVQLLYNMVMCLQSDDKTLQRANGEHQADIARDYLVKNVHFVYKYSQEKSMI